jgi:predicted regulator of Ras-like GTPase activity (Roadblock/LC7/MglB family)
MAVQGNLKDMRLASLISINCNEMNQARLLLRHRGQEATLFFEGGNIVHMALDSQEGEEVIYELLTWEEGEFELEQGVPPPRHTVTTGWSGLVLEGMHRIDESTAGWEVEWDGIEAEEAKETKDETAERMARGLKRIAGIEGVLICSREGKVLGQDTSGDPIKETALTAFVGHQAEALGVLLNAGQLEQVILAGEKRRAIIVAHEQNYVGLSLAQRTLAESIAPVIQITLRRYR